MVDWADPLHLHPSKGKVRAAGDTDCGSPQTWPECHSLVSLSRGQIPLHQVPHCLGTSTILRLRFSHVLNWDKDPHLSRKDLINFRPFNYNFMLNLNSIITRNFSLLKHHVKVS